MADIMLHTSANTGFTCISNTFIDDFMKDANGEYVKIYLYLLRFNRAGFTFSISQLADCLESTEKDVMRALAYWEKKGLLCLEYSADNELSGIHMNDVNGNNSSFTSVNYAATPTTVSPVTAAAASNTTVPNSIPNYSAEQLEAFMERPEISELMQITQTYIGRPLSVTEQNAILFWFDELHMNLDLIDFLIDYCVDNNHKSFHYMNTVAINWTEDGITTVEDARKSTSAHTNTVFSIKKAMGISNRDLVESELNYIDKWTNTFSFNVDIICQACERTIASTNKPNFKYADSILSSWHKSKVTSLEDIAKLDDEFTKASVTKLSDANRAKKPAANATKTNNKFNNFSQRNYDYDELEKKLLGF